MVLKPHLSEREFQAQVLQLAKACGWLYTHFRPARTLRGWRTPLEGSPGFPDVVLAHAGHGLVVFLELKAELGRLTVDQLYWINHLNRCDAHAYVFYPDDWEKIEALLTKGDLP